MKTKVGINGFGRIGRNAFKIAQDRELSYEIAAINDLTTPSTLAHLLKYDSCFGRFDGTVEATEDSIIVNGQKIRVFAEKDPENILWAKLGVDIVMECTGHFTSREGAEKHIRAGAKKVVISAPASGEDITIVMGVNEESYEPSKHDIISNASCTTNCLAPFAKVMDENFGIKKGLMTTVHSYTNDQRILDMPHKDLRRSRAASMSMIPTTTGAARAVSRVLPQLSGKLNGLALRVPTPAVSVVDIVLELDKKTNVKEVNETLKRASEYELKGILGYCEEALVSIDFKQDDHSSIIDSKATMMMDDDMVKILAWYDNEWGYSNRVVDLIEYIIKKGLQA